MRSSSREISACHKLPGRKPDARSTNHHTAYDFSGKDKGWVCTERLQGILCFTPVAFCSCSRYFFRYISWRRCVRQAKCSDVCGTLALAISSILLLTVDAFNPASNCCSAKAKRIVIGFWRWRLRCTKTLHNCKAKGSPSIGRKRGLSHLLGFQARRGMLGAGRGPSSSRYTNFGITTSMSKQRNYHRYNAELPPQCQTEELPPRLEVGNYHLNVLTEELSPIAGITTQTRGWELSPAFPVINQISPNDQSL